MTARCIRQPMALMLVVGALSGFAGCTSQSDVHYIVSNPPASFARMTDSLNRFSAQHGLQPAPPHRQPFALGGFWAPNVRYIEPGRPGIELAAYDLTNGVDVTLLEQRHASPSARFLELDSALQADLQKEFGAAVNRHENHN